LSNSTQLFQHPKYKYLKPDWIRYRDLYEGKHDILVTLEYLWAHAIELKGDDTAKRLRAAREQRTRYLNLPEILISLWTSYFFRKDMEIGPVSKAILRPYGAEANIDGYDTSLKTFVRDRMLRSFLLYGKAIVLADAFGKTGKSAGEDAQIGFRPYLELLEPLDVVDWDIEASDSKRIGRYNVLRHEFDLNLPRLRANQQPKTQRQSHELAIIDGRYTIIKYTADKDEQGNYRLYDPKNAGSGYAWQLDGEPIQTKLTEIPVVVMDSEPWLHDACEETLRYYNLRSNRDNINYFQGYEKGFVKGINTTDNEAMKAITEYTWSFLPTDGDAFTLPSGDPTALSLACEESLNSVFKVGLNQLRFLPSDSKLTQAEGAQSEEKDNTYALVEATLEDIEVAVNESINNWAKFLGKNDFKSDIELDRAIKPDSVDQFLSVYGVFQDKFSKVEVVERAAIEKAIKKLGLPEDREEEALKAVREVQLGDALGQEAQKQKRQAVIDQALNGEG
jgi:hypothetical protein